MRTVFSFTSHRCKKTALKLTQSLFSAFLLILLTTGAFVSPAMAVTQFQLAKTWVSAIPDDAITASTTGLANDASLASISVGNNTDTGTPVVVVVGETATLGAEIFTTGTASRYITSSWVCDDDAGSIVASDGTGTVTVMAADLDNTITCTLTNTLSNVTENTVCVVQQPAYTQDSVNCTANDLALSSPAVTILSPCNFPGDTATLTIGVSITTTASQRYDLGLWFSVDGDPNGDGSETGICTAVTIPNNLIDADGLPSNADGSPNARLDPGDFCGDVVSTNNGPPDIPVASLGTFDLVCNDTDGDVVDDEIAVGQRGSRDGRCTADTEALRSRRNACESGAVVDGGRLGDGRSALEGGRQTVIRRRRISPTSNIKSAFQTM